MRMLQALLQDHLKPTIQPVSIARDSRPHASPSALLPLENHDTLSGSDQLPGAHQSRQPRPNDRYGTRVARRHPLHGPPTFLDRLSSGAGRRRPPLGEELEIVANCDAPSAGAGLHEGITAGKGQTSVSQTRSRLAHRPRRSLLARLQESVIDTEEQEGGGPLPDEHAPVILSG